MHQRITDDLESLLQVLPPRIKIPLARRENLSELLEIVMDLGRLPEARFLHEEVVLSSQEVTEEDLEHVVSRLSPFGADNRAGIERSLHRISAVRNRKGKIVGLTCRVGRAVYGTIKIIEDLVQSGKSILLLGKPGVGKTTMLREVARVLADDLKKRVVIVDTSNEIAGDGDIPHPAIGHARRMQVPTPALQHEVMIEAVENHMPEVIIIDEIGRELEAAAARTIAERGVQLIATAHGNTLDNLIINPTLSDLVGGVQTVTLGDEEARRRRTQKTILERKAPPTFHVLVEIQDWYRVAVHENVADTVDSIFRGNPIPPEVRWIDAEAQIHMEREKPARSSVYQRRGYAGETPSISRERPSTRLFLFGINRGITEQVVQGSRFPVEIVNDLRQSDVLLTVKSYYRRRPQTLLTAEEMRIPVFVLRKGSIPQIEQTLTQIMASSQPQDPVARAMEEAEAGAKRVLAGETPVELTPQTSYIRRLQHQIATRHNLVSQSTGKEPFRRVKLFKNDVANGD